MPTEAHLTQLDSPAVKAFINGPLTEFLNDLRAIMTDEGDVPSVSGIAGGRSTASTIYLNKPLALGYIGGDDTVHGATFSKAVLSFAKSADDVLQHQDTVFKKIENAMMETIDKFLKQQGDNLQGIKAADFLDLLGVKSLGPGSATTGAIPPPTV
ncbi:type VII secretion system-associated protein [Streptomyces sp. NPDC056707]|uniref:type VII secretion system-associated protein n=1 Tax=Streptomyces sp. NPDC056707 TaxID=3345919 RepID=UPI0036B5CECE